MLYYVNIEDLHATRRSTDYESLNTKIIEVVGDGSDLLLATGVYLNYTYYIIILEDAYGC